MSTSSGRGNSCSCCGHLLNEHAKTNDSKCKRCKKTFEICQAGYHGEGEEGSHGWRICKIPCSCGKDYYPDKANAASPLQRHEYLSTHPAYSPLEEENYEEDSDSLAPTTQITLTINKGWLQFYDNNKQLRSTKKEQWADGTQLFNGTQFPVMEFSDKTGYYWVWTADYENQLEIQQSIQVPITVSGDWIQFYDKTEQLKSTSREHWRDDTLVYQGTELPVLRFSDETGYYWVWTADYDRQLEIQQSIQVPITVSGDWIQFYDKTEQLKSTSREHWRDDTQLFNGTELPVLRFSDETGYYWVWTADYENQLPTQGYSGRSLGKQPERTAQFVSHHRTLSQDSEDPLQSVTQEYSDRSLGKQPERTARFVTHHRTLSQESDDPIQHTQNKLEEQMANLDVSEQSSQQAESKKIESVSVRKTSKGMVECTVKSHQHKGETFLLAKDKWKPQGKGKGFLYERPSDGRTFFTKEIKEAAKTKNKK